MISEHQLEQIGEFVSSQSLDDQSISRLRQRFQDIHFTYCLDDDVYASLPVREYEGFNLYLIDSSNHCLGFTRDLQMATGVVVAQIEDD